MEDLNRRSIIALGLTAAASTPLIALSTPALAAPAPNYGPTAGKDIGAGRRLIIEPYIPYPRGVHPARDPNSYGSGRFMFGDRWRFGIECEVQDCELDPCG